MLPAAYIGRFGARAIANPVVTFDNDAAHAALAKLDCGGKTNRTGTDNHDVRFHIDQCAHVPASQFRARFAKLACPHCLCAIASIQGPMFWVEAHFLARPRRSLNGMRMGVPTTTGARGRVELSC